MSRVNKRFYPEEISFETLEHISEDLHSQCRENLRSHK